MLKNEKLSLNSTVWVKIPKWRWRHFAYKPSHSRALTWLGCKHPVYTLYTTQSDSADLDHWDKRFDILLLSALLSGPCFHLHLIFIETQNPVVNLQKTGCMMTKCQAGDFPLAKCLSGIMALLLTSPQIDLGVKQWVEIFQPQETHPHDDWWGFLNKSCSPTECSWLISSKALEVTLVFVFLKSQKS